MTWYSGIVSRAKTGKNIGLAVGLGLPALTIAASIFRGNRPHDPFKDPGADPGDTILAEGIPQLVPATAYSLPQPEQAPAGGMGRMMGEEPVLNGYHGNKVLARMGRLPAGMTAAQPSAMGSDGASLADGRPVQDLGGPSAN